MKVKIAVTDANIFIDLYDIGLTKSFFNFELEIHTTSAVLYELYSEQQEILQAYQSVGRLFIHNLHEQDFVEIYFENYPKSLSEADKSVLHVANKINACVLSSDKTLRNYAKNKEIEYHGMFWIFDKFVETGILSPRDAISKLNQLIASNFLFRNNQKLVGEVEKRLKIWSSLI
ncbi:MAG: PIN domain-containing protein [Paludibacteraceae bacterium]